MDGKKQPPKSEDGFNDPFAVGQLVGMMVILTYIENNNGIPKDYLDKLRAACAEKSAAYLEKPTEDIYLLVDNLVQGIKP